MKHNFFIYLGIWLGCAAMLMISKSISIEYKCHLALKQCVSEHIMDDRPIGKCLESFMSVNKAKECLK